MMISGRRKKQSKGGILVLNLRKGPPWLAMAEATGTLGQASGNPAVFESNGDPMQHLILNLAPVQSGSGDPSPSNVRPFVAWTGATVRRSGKNMLLLRDSYIPGTTATSVGLTRTTKADGTINISGTSTGSGSTVFTNFSPTYGEFALPPGTYVITGCPSGGGTTTYNIRVSTGGTGTGYPELTHDYGSGGTFTLSEYTADIYVTIRLRNTWMQGQTSPIDLDFPIMIRRQEDSADYSPPSNLTSSEIETVFPEEIYGGTVDLTTGILTRTWGIVDLGAQSYTSYVGSTGKGLFRFPALWRKYGNSIPAMCSAYSFYGNGTLSHMQSSLPDLQFGFQITNTNCWIRNDAYTTVDQIKAALTGVKMITLRDEPVIYHLSTPQIRSLKGENVVWSSTGDVAVTYKTGNMSPGLSKLALVFWAHGGGRLSG